MAGVEALYSCTSSVMAWLRLRWLQQPAIQGVTCAFEVFSSQDMLDLSGLSDSTVGCYLHRIAIDEHRRNVPIVEANWGQQRFHPLPVVAHLLFFVHATGDEDARKEQVIATWLMREFHQHPQFDGGELSEAGLWAADERLSIVPENLDIESLTRIWQAFQPSYRLSLAYNARIIDVEADPIREYPAVVASRMTIDNEVGP